jgi:hypothetical protein
MLSGAVAAVVLLPVPAFALTFTLGSWTSSDPNWKVSSGTNELFFWTSTTANTGGTITFSAPITNLTGVSQINGNTVLQNIDPVSSFILTSGTGTGVTVSFQLTYADNTMQPFLSNQFTGGGSGPVAVKDLSTSTSQITNGSSPAASVQVILTFTGAATYTVSGSPSATFIAH